MSAIIRNKLIQPEWKLPIKRETDVLVVSAGRVGVAGVDVTRGDFARFRLRVE